MPVSGLLGEPVTVRLACVLCPPPAICSSSFCVSWRAPIRLSTRLLVDIGFLLLVLEPSLNVLASKRSAENIYPKETLVPALNGNRSCSGQIAALLIQHGVRIVECAGWKAGSDCTGLGSRNFFYFVRCQLTSAYPANYAVVVLG